MAHLHRIGLFVSALFFHFALLGQSLPDEWHISDDGKMLLMGGKASTGLYDSATIRGIYLTFPQTNYWTLLQQNYNTHTDLPATMTVDGVAYDSVGVRFKGQTSYQMIGNSQKKSFNITVDYKHPDQKLMGYKTLNLNNSYEDESFMREVFYLHQIRKHIPAAKACYVSLYLNGSSWGIYPSIQQLNKDFLEEWYLSNDGINWRADKPAGSGGNPGGWGDGTAALNYLGADTSTYKQYYTLKSSDIIHPWDKLVATCNALCNTTTANLPSVLPNFLDVDRTLWFLASEIAFSDDDSYVFKGKMDYYVYYEPETGRMVPQEFDGNTVMNPNAVNWSPFYNANKVNYPLLNKMLVVPAWRQRYLAHMRTIISDELNPAACNAIFDNYKLQIDALVQADPKKLYTYSKFLSEITLLKNYVNNRRNNLLANSEVAQAAPVIQSALYVNNAGVPWSAPAQGEQVTVNATVTSTSGIYAVNCYYSNALVGNFTPLQMFDDGQHNDGAAGDGIFGITLPGQAAATWVRFYVEAVANTTAKSVSYHPAGAEHNVFYYIVSPAASNDTLIVINELMASNSATAFDEAGEYDDWVELYNKSDYPVDISGYYLTDNPVNLDKWEVPAGTILPAHGYKIFWADEDSSQGPFHMNFKLSASGESLMLLDSALKVIDSVSWGQQVTDMGYARVPNGTGPFVIQQPTFSNSNNLSSGITDPTVEYKLAVWPNPAGSNVNITMQASGAENLLRILNSIGQQVFEEQGSGQHSLEVSSWPNGIYYVHFSDMVKKLVVCH